MKKNLYPAVSMAFILIIWQIVVIVWKIPAFILPGPAAVFSALSGRCTSITFPFCHDIK